MTLLAAGQRRPRTSGPALARLLPLPVEEFAERHWGREALLARAAALPGGPGGLSDLLDLDAVDALVSTSGLRTPFLRVAKDGKVVEPGRWTGSGGAGAEVGDQVRDDALLGLFADGSTLVLQGLHRTHPPLVRFATDLAAELGHPVQVNAYVTPPQSRGFDPHYDVHDVFVIQVAGRKRWQVRRPVLEAPLRSQPWTDRKTAVAARAAEPPELEEVLEPGDVLYLPRGWLHSAEALGETSAHVTVGIHSITRYALAEALLAGAAGAEELRRSLPLGVDVADPEQLREDLASTLEALAAELRGADAQAVADRMRRRFWPQSRPGPLSPVRQAAAAAAVGPGTRVRLRPALRVRLAEGTPTDDQAAPVLLLLPERQLSLPAQTRTALERLLADGGAVVGELPVDDPGDAEVLVRRLLREGVVVPDEGQQP
ncbi:ribosomal protein L16 Arg81 hydroxylase [Motilibacter rhizosphaerae]|uniref:Ribosomal protein L16 Arg81 hydroxylase n=1 Tax=Motilibacter rhizosphaerae TaxID=598652 RepID=A0A4Q7NSE8_9ACTN|nr:cupin domain-containing protein [Motilibacter rhizosphaerae]RZS89945.1 ribosomal protein L16 Arg81 hydroxylase [Motilibacter rhizosphaerae]